MNHSLLNIGVLLLSILLFTCRDVGDAKEETNSLGVKKIDNNEVDWKRFLEYWPGDYNNGQQVKEQLAAKMDSSDRSAHLSLRIRKVELPSFGKDVYYAEWFAYNNPKKVTRQRIYAFENRDTTLVLKLHIFPRDSMLIARTRGAYNALSKLKDLTPKDMYPLLGCDIFFKWGKTEYSGAMIKGACGFPAPTSGIPIYSWSQMRLKEDAFEYLDGWFNTDGSVYYEISKDWYVFQKIQGIN